MTICKHGVPIKRECFMCKEERQKEYCATCNAEAHEERCDVKHTCNKEERYDCYCGGDCEHVKEEPKSEYNQECSNKDCQCHKSTLRECYNCKICKQQ
jgi:hypothetical protein